jgi:hypothetical protein
LDLARLTTSKSALIPSDFGTLRAVELLWGLMGE